MDQFFCGAYYQINSPNIFFSIVYLFENISLLWSVCSLFFIRIVPCLVVINLCQTRKTTGEKFFVFFSLLLSLLLRCDDARYLQRGALLSKTKMHGSTFTKSIRHSRSFSKSIGNGPKTTIATVTSAITSTNDFLRIMFACKIRPLTRIIGVFFITIAATSIIIVVVIVVSIMNCSLFGTIDSLVRMRQRCIWILLKRER